jgi:hypothetical protein
MLTLMSFGGSQLAHLDEEERIRSIYFREGFFMSGEELHEVALKKVVTSIWVLRIDAVGLRY